MPTTRARAPWVGLAAALVLVAVAFALPPLLDWEVWARAPRSLHTGELPPLHGYWDPKLFGAGTLPAIAIALLGWRYAVDLAERLSWGRLLATSYVVGLAWLLALALVDGSDGISRVLGDKYEYLRSAREVTNLHTLLSTYADRIPYSAPDNWPTHPAGHPPGALLFFVGLVKVGLGGDLAAGLVVTGIAAATAVAVLVTLRALGAETVARRAAPFLVLTPAAVFMAVSADAVFAAVAAWGLACLAIGATSASRGRLVAWSALAGLLLGAGVMMSYGLPLVGLLAVAVLVLARSWLPLPVAAGAALVVVLAFAAGGFSWWSAYPVLNDRYWDGIAADRPAAYWMWGNLAALVVCAGPLLGAGLAQVVALRRRADRVVLWLVGAAALAIALADLSRMSKAEVERIWLPFVPWLLVSTALLPERWRRWGMLVQVVSALLVQQLLYTSW
ncbi:membrane protein [Nocardioides hankookensis]|uniref:Glycosyltransferase RgtA/B/C/D-like domain-containing protein n=1 Tax=Nocardioides hankookensis TaxID=443157 RepID=A0ABW1LM72_9ACTN